LPELKRECDVALVAAAEKGQHDMLTELHPIFQLFAVTSTSKTAPGDKYLAENSFLRVGLS
jgi:hypothetical protein